MKSPAQSHCKEVFKDPVQWLAFGFGSGCLPVAPGTFGTIAAIPVYLLLQGTNLWLYLSVTMILFISGIWICGTTSRKLGVHDHSGIVWDEIVGYQVTMILAPPGWFWILAGFVLFRFFDIVKPWPVKLADKKLGGGFGIMFDDVIAGFFAFIVIQLIVYSGIVQ